MTSCTIPTGASAAQTEPAEGGALAPLEAADLHDQLLMAGHDLERLQRLLAGTCDALLAHFHHAMAELDRGGSPRAELAQALTALQFQDMASQLIVHTHQRLRSCADRLARDAFGADGDDGEAVVVAMPSRPNPVTQDEMDAGSVELF